MAKLVPPKKPYKISLVCGRCRSDQIVKTTEPCAEGRLVVVFGYCPLCDLGWREGAVSASAAS